MQFGARPLKRAIQKYIEDELAEIFLEGSVEEGDTVIIGYDKESDKMTHEIEKFKVQGSRFKVQDDGYGKMF